MEMSADQNGNNGLQEGQVRLQEALYGQENILNQEREEKNNLHVTLMGTKEEHNKLMDKLKVAEAKAKSVTKIETDAKRKQKMIQDKNHQIEMLKSDLEQNKLKATKFDKINAHNAELVTRKCALESSVQSKDKKLQEFADKVRHLESVVMQLEQEAVAPLPASSQHNAAATGGLTRVQTGEKQMLSSSANTSSLHAKPTAAGATNKSASNTERRTTAANNSVPKTNTTAPMKRGNTGHIDSKTATNQLRGA